MNKNLNIIHTFASNIAWQIDPVDEIIYILNKKNNKFLYFEEVSKEIWLLIEKKMSVHDIINSIVDKYNVEFKVVENDVIDFFNILYTEGVIVENE